ncbi:MAG: hypothetical protein PHS54_07570, partial [Clostridia bacterium]|nr:hypothetical protein [Clostridia bacterium]
MKKILLISSIVLVLLSCNNSTDKNGGSNTEPKVEQLNITILLDLSDRLIQDVQPCQKERDIAIVMNIVEIFRLNMESKGAYKSQDKIKIIFTPAPMDASINNIAKTLTVDLSKMDNSQKKVVFDNITKDFSTGLNEIFDLTLKNETYPGSDIWRFFKYDAEQYCISKDESYRDILVIVSDGYIYHDQTLDKIKNRTTWSTNTLFTQEGFVNNPNWLEKFEKGDYGLIFSGQTYEDLDILFLEVNPKESHKNDEDIIRAYLNKWV